ncbi:MAG: alanine racemase [Lentisphaerae bacterium]|jgi:alanine racemase|nr:alanine racemase [Lentisphaerota bacterium]
MKTECSPSAYNNDFRRVWLDISLDALRLNYRHIASAVAPCRIMAILKANAYGLGVRPIASALINEGIHSIGVTEPHEAEEILNLNTPIQILGSVLPDELPYLIASNITLPITDLPTARAISREALKQKKQATVHFKIDTGMGRLGILARDAVKIITTATALEGLNPVGIYSHLPIAYDDNDYTTNQINTLRQIITTLRQNGITFKERHIANSDAINNCPTAYAAPFNLVRAGINLHGSFDSQGMRRLDLTPILTLKTRLTAIRTLPAGTAIGYGLTYRLSRKTRVGTISAGYADGLPLALSNRGYVLINNTPCPVLGRLSMDYTTVSLDQVPQAKIGAEVTCLGGTGPMAISVDDWAKLKNTHPYEIICSFGTRVERRYN